MVISFFLLLLTLLFAPLAFGTTEPWSIATVEILVAITAITFSNPFTKKSTILYKTPGLLPLLLLLLFMYLQCVPLPASLVQLIAPGIHGIYQPILDIQQTGHWIPLTVNRQATVLECLRISSYVLFYFLTIQLLSNATRLQKTVHLVAWLALFIAFFAILQKYTAPANTLYWFREVKWGSVFGPWVYKNQYAGFMVMTCPLLLAMLFVYRPEIEDDEPLREKIISLFSMPGANIHLFFGFGVILVLTSIFIAMSRGGILSISLALFIFFLLLARKQSKIQRLTPFLLIFSLILTVGWFSWDPILDRFYHIFNLETGAIENIRLTVWQDCLYIIADFLTTGTGFRTYENIYPLYQSFSTPLIYEHAHNDYLELLTDSGIIGFGLSAWFIITILKTGYKYLFTRRDNVSFLLTIGSLSGLAGILYFSITDFNMHNGANGLYFFFLCALLVSAGHTRRFYQSRPTLLQPVKWKPARLLSLFISSIFLCSVILMNYGANRAATLYRQAEGISASMQRPEKKLNRMFSRLEAAAVYAPFSGKHPYAIGNIELTRKNKSEALVHYIDAALKQPMDSSYLQTLGLMIAESNPTHALLLMEAGYRRALQKIRPLQLWVTFLLNQDKRELAIQLLQNELANDPLLLTDIYPILVRYSFQQSEIIAILPQLTSSWLTFWNLSTKNSVEQEQYSIFIEHALDYIEQEKTIKPQYFLQVIRYYRKSKQEEKAIKTIRRSIVQLPDYAHFHILLGDYYLKEGILYRAREEYEQAMLLKPNNKGIQKRIKRVTDKENSIR